jgi:uncharacterized RDD family membrane protein YckC
MGGQQLPPYGQFGTPQANWAPTAAPRGDLADWGQRALGWLIDWVIVAVPIIILYIFSAVAGTIVFSLIGWLWGLGFGIWFGIQLGQSGSTPGMRVIGLKCVNMKTGQVLGAGMGVVRALLHAVASALCFVPYVVDMLFPLWDPQRQTLADKIVGTVVVRVPSEGFSLVPKSIA